MMMALRLDAICAKLKLNISPTESGISTSENNNDSKSMDVISRLSLEIESSGMKQTAADGDEVSSLSCNRALPSTTAVPGDAGRDSGGTTVSADGTASSIVGRRNRRKNFQPRCIQEVCHEEVLEEKVEMTLAEDDDDRLDHDDRSLEEASDLGVLDLRVGDLSKEVEIMDADDDELYVDNCGVIDLSIHRKTNDNLPTKMSTNKTERNGQLKTVKMNLMSDDALDISLKDGHPPSHCLDKCSVDDFTLKSMNKLLKIYGLSEESGSNSQLKRLPAAPTPSKNALLFTLDLMNAMSVLPKSRASSSPSFPPEASKLSFPCDDLELTKSSASLSSQSIETSRNASMDEEDSSPSEDLVKNLKQRPFIPNFVGFSSKFSLPKRSNLKEYYSTADYSKYAKRFNSFEECCNPSCRERGYKEHFHCTACTSRVYLKKEEMVRHFKWHKKREDSLQHGFMRYSPLDDCSKRFSTHCGHNGKHTHYHCLQGGCSKVYISTSDVQMHANYHRKDSAIIQEGFQRFRATENCAMVSCAFAGQKTTHFHCRRTGCNFTFKNKADMEKHKTYHQKDEILTRDGFKKFMKYERCQFPGCHYSRVSNHIHCIRPDCNYVLHSTGQLYSHKRKHERQEIEQSAYKQLGSSSLTDVSIGLSSTLESLSSGCLTVVGQPAIVSAAVKQETGVGISGRIIVKPSDSKSGDVTESQNVQLISDGLKVEVKKEFQEEEEEEEEEEDQKCFFSPGLVNLAGKDLGDSLNLPISFAPLPEGNGKSDDEEETEELAAAAKFTPSVFFMPKTLPPVNDKKERDESWKRYLTRYTANDPCHARCQFLYKDHYHCNQIDCGWLFRSKDGVREHAKFHEQQDRVTALTFMKYDAETKCSDGCEYSEKLLHYHCLWTKCSHVISSKDSVFSRLEHHKFHDSFGRKTTGFSCGSSLDSLKRKRGRPPKFPKNDIPMIPKIEMTEEELLTQAELTGLNSPIANGFQKYEEEQPCPDDKCVYAQTEHYHCVRPRCHHVTNRSDVLALHAKDFHSFIVIADGFEFFDRNVNCRRPHCHSNQSNRHFHCVRPNCDFSFVRYSTMVQHDRKHRAAGSLGDSLNAKTINLSANLSSCSASATIASASKRGSAGDAGSAATLFPVSSVVSVTDSPSVGLPPVLLTSLSSLSSHNVTPIKQGVQGHDLQLTSSPLKVVSIAPKPSAILTLQAQVSSKRVDIVPSHVASTVPSGTREAPLTILLQQKTSTAPAVDWVSMKLKLHHKIHQNCGRPFCKLKKKDHYHCFDCNQAFSDPGRLKSHVSRHGVASESARMARDNQDNQATSGELKTVQQREGGSAPLGETETASNVEDEEMMEAASDRQNVRCSEGISRDDITEGSEQLGNSGECCEFNEADVGRLVIDLSSMKSGSDGTSVMESDDVSIASSVSVGPSSFLSGSSCSTKMCRKRELDERLCVAGDQKRPKVAAAGYEKFRFSEDCGQDRCAYRLSMTHYHCSRPDCGYSFCDHSRFLQHSDRHQRIDVIMGDQFRHFHTKTDCQRVSCEYARNATHFHCLVCSFVCTDSNKVVAHRKHHSKMDRIAENGFRKFSVGEDCEFTTCVHRFKQTHYHCSDCSHIVMGPSQMGLHKARHASEAKTNSVE